MNDHRHHHQHDAEVCQRLDALAAAMRELEQSFSRHFLNGEQLRLPFTKAQPRLLDDKGGNALAYGVYNPNNFRVYLGLAGANAAADGFVVPKQKLVVVPATINGAVELLADEKEIGEAAGEKGTVWRWRFPTPQPFYVGALA